MTERMKAFLEFMSKQDEETKKNASKLEKDALIAFAAEKGLTLNDEDFRKPDDEGEVSLKEADAIAGGGECYCIIGGGGTEDHWETTNSKGGIDTFEDYVCACVAYGEGHGEYSFWGDYTSQQRCSCIGKGTGGSMERYRIG